MSQYDDTRKRLSNTPVFSLTAAIVFGGFSVVLILTGHMESALFQGVVISTLPSLLASLYAERTARDVRNGVVQEKVRQGTHEALNESGVAKVAATAISTQPAATDALNALVRANERLLNRLDAVEHITDNDNQKGAQS